MASSNHTASFVQLHLFATDKRCNKCHKFLPLDHFYKDKSQPDGLQRKCVVCCKAYFTARYATKPELFAERNKRYHESHKEEISAKGRAYHATNRERLRAKSLAYRADNLERLRAHDKAYTAANRVRKTAYMRTWVAAHPDYSQAQRDWRNANPDRSRPARERYRKTPKAMLARRIRNQRRRALRRSAKGFYDRHDVLHLYELQHGLCAYCTKSLQGVYHVDHIVALSKGGSNWPDNICLACATCNVRKSNKSADEFRRLLEQQKVTS